MLYQLVFLDFPTGENPPSLSNGEYYANSYPKQFISDRVAYNCLPISQTNCNPLANSDRHQRGGDCHNSNSLTHTSYIHTGYLFTNPTSSDADRSSESYTLGSISTTRWTDWRGQKTYLLGIE